jgi:ADP-heptose:LPS heptosyltransferase
VIATDSGALHLAAAVEAPVIGLYGPADPLEFGPWCPPERRRIVRVQLPCSPCRTLVDPPCGATREPACVTDITVDAVLAAIAELLGA